MKQITQQEAIALGKSNALMDLPPKDRAMFQLHQQFLAYDFGQFQLDMEELLGRPVWTHEFANAERLKAEAAGKIPALTLDQIMDMIPAEKRILVVT